MLSDTNIKRELGRNLLIYPLKSDNIKGASINLTASEYAWSLGTKETIVQNGVITIPPHDTGLIETEETVAVSGRLAGTYHSRVKTASMGGGHVGTTLNPYWIGHSLIAIHNHTDHDITIKVGDSFVTLVLYYLNKKAARREDNQSGREDILHAFTVSEEASNWLNEQPHSTRDWKTLKKLMEADPAYSALKAQGLKRKILSTIALVVIGCALVLLLAFWPKESRWYSVLPVALSGYGVVIFEMIYKRWRT